MSTPFLRAEVVGGERVVSKFRFQWPASTRQRVGTAVRALGLLLEADVKTSKLNGGVLKRRSGRLSRSINTRYTETQTEFVSSTGTSLSYGRVWEVTGSRAFTIVPKTKEALFWPGAAHPVKSVFHPAQAPRPFLKPALEGMRPTIRKTLSEALVGLGET